MQHDERAEALKQNLKKNYGKIACQLTDLGYEINREDVVQLLKKENCGSDFSANLNMIYRMELNVQEVFFKRLSNFFEPRVEAFKLQLGILKK